MTHEPIKFRGSMLRLARQMLAALLPFALAVCFLLFGEAGGRVFLASMAVVPVVLVLAFVIAQVDQLSYSHDEGVWRRPLRKPIPADSLREVQFTETMGMVQVNARTMGGGGEILMVSLKPADVDRLIAALESGSRTVHVTHREVSHWKPALVVTALVAVPFALGYWYLLDKNPLVTEYCHPTPWPTELSDAAPTEVAGWSIPNPGRGSGVSIAAAPILGGPTGGAGSGFLALAGLNTGLDLYRYACCARFGLVPLLLKASLISGKRTVEIREYQRGDTSAVVLIGEGGPRPPMLALVGRPGSQVLEIELSVIDEDMLESILAGLQPAR